MTTPATARPGLARAGFVLGALFSVFAFTRVDAVDQSAIDDFVDAHFSDEKTRAEAGAPPPPPE